MGFNKIHLWNTGQKLPGMIFIIIKAWKIHPAKKIPKDIYTAILSRCKAKMLE